MPKTLLTGGTGFIGSHLARALAAEGADLRLLIRRDSAADHLADLDFERVNGDVTDRRAVRRGVAGVERVFHVAGVTSMRRGSAERVFAVNVGGARIVAEEALQAGVGRMIHTSSAAALGPAAPHGRADESQPFIAGSLGIPYVNSKHESEVEVLRVAAHGLEVVIVNPTFVLGPDDPTGTSMALVRRFLQRRIPAYVNGGINISDVRDVAAGQLAAAQRGRPGERYVLGGRNFTLHRLFADLARLSGVAPPSLRLPAGLAAGGAELVERLGLPVPVSADEARSAALWWTYSGAKAKRELGYEPRPHEETLRDALEWQLAELGGQVGEPGPVEASLELLGRALRVAARLAP
jgi:dihydroflavonol-4-reductase